MTAHKLGALDLLSDDPPLSDVASLQFPMKPGRVATFWSHTRPDGDCLI